MQRRNTVIFYAKLGAILFFLLISVIIAACGSSDNSQVNPGNPVVTVTINLGQVNGSPTPPLKNYYCGGWATDTTPAYSPTAIVNVYAKFTHTDSNGNPTGVGGATAVATVYWPDGSIDTQVQHTTSDGLAVFSIMIKPSALNKEVLVQITFTAPNGVTCTIPQAAYFTAILISPTASSTVTPSGTNTATPPGTPTGSPGPTGTASPTGTATPSPTPTRKPGH